MHPEFNRRHVLFAVIAAVTTSTSLKTFAAPASTETSGEDAQIPPSARLEPDELARMLKSRKEKPLILQIGVRFLYAQAHVPGAEYVGATENTEGLEALRQRVAKLNKGTPIVLYCGCCPWDRCPNIRPAFKELRAAGFTRVRALHIANNFGADWADQGYPVERDH